MKRSADFTPELKEKGAGALSKLQIPKKTKLFVDQTMRERENSIGNVNSIPPPQLNFSEFNDVSRERMIIEMNRIEEISFAQKVFNI